MPKGPFWAPGGRDKLAQDKQGKAAAAAMAAQSDEVRRDRLELEALREQAATPSPPPPPRSAAAMAAPSERGAAWPAGAGNAAGAGEAEPSDDEWQRRVRNARGGRGKECGGGEEG